MKFLQLTCLSCFAFLRHFAVAENATSNNTSALPVLVEQFMMKSAESASNEMDDLTNVAIVLLSQTTFDNETQNNASQTDHKEKIELSPDIVFQLDNQIIRLTNNQQPYFDNETQNNASQTDHKEKIELSPDIVIQLDNQIIRLSNNQSMKQLLMNEIVERPESNEGLKTVDFGKMETQNRFVKKLRMQNRMLKRKVQNLNRQVQYILKGKKRASVRIQRQTARISQLQFDLLEAERKRINLMEHIQIKKCQGNLEPDFKQENNDNDEDEVKVFENIFW